MTLASLRKNYICVCVWGWECFPRNNNVFVPFGFRFQRILIIEGRGEKKKNKDLFSGKRDITWYIPNLIK